DLGPRGDGRFHDVPFGLIQHQILAEQVLPEHLLTIEAGTEFRWSLVARGQHAAQRLPDGATDTGLRHGSSLLNVSWVTGKSRAGSVEQLVELADAEQKQAGGQQHACVPAAHLAVRAAPAGRQPARWLGEA